MDILTRAVLALLIISLGLGLYVFYQYWTRSLARSQFSEIQPLHRGAFTLVYFTTPTCIPCKTVQRPAIQKLGQLLGDNLQVLEIDASQQPEVANRWGVMSVPTTFVIDPRGEVRHVNHGVTRYDQLLMQIQSR